MVINAFSASLLSLSPVITRPPMSAVVMQPLGSDLYDSCSYFVSLSPSTPILFFIYTPLFPMLTPITRRKQNSSVSSFFFFFFCTIVLQHFFLFFYYLFSLVFLPRRSSDSLHTDFTFLVPKLIPEAYVVHL